MRLLKEAQQGNPHALQSLLEPYLPGIWSIARGYLDDREQAIASVVGFRDRLRERVRTLAPDQAFGLQLYALLWQHLSADLEPSAAASIEPVFPRPGPTLKPRGPEDQRIIQETLSVTPPLPRLVYLFWLVTDLPAGRLAEIVDLPEERVRGARAQVTQRIHEALAQ